MANWLFWTEYITKDLTDTELAVVESYKPWNSLTWDWKGEQTENFRQWILWVYSVMVSMTLLIAVNKTDLCFKYCKGQAIVCFCFHIFLKICLLSPSLSFSLSLSHTCTNTHPHTHAHRPDLRSALASTEPVYWCGQKINQNHQVHCFSVCAPPKKNNNNKTSQCDYKQLHYFWNYFFNMASQQEPILADWITR